MIKECFKSTANDPRGILYGMGEQPFIYGEGKRLFHGKANISDKTGMYPTTEEDKEVKDLFLRMSDLQYYDKSKIPYVAPPVSKIYPARNSFVHNCLKNKGKINLDHFYKIYDSKILNIEF